MRFGVESACPTIDGAVNAPAQTHTKSPKSRRARDTRTPSPQHDKNALDAYFTRIGRHRLLSAEDEATLATELRAAKQAVWLALFAQPGVIQALTELPEDALESGPWAELAAACADAPDPLLRAELAEALIAADPEMRLADRLAGDLSAEQRTHVGAARAIVRRIRERFVGANLRLVAKTAMRYRGRGLPVSDLVQEGNLGLMKAVERYDHRRGCRFSTYAMWWIKSTITRGLANHGRTIRVPTGVHHTYGRLVRASARIEVECGRPATDDELADVLGQSVEAIARARTAMIKPVSLDAPLGDEARDRVGDRLADEDAAAFTNSMDDEAALLREALGSLSPIEAEILRHRFGLDDGNERTLQEIGEANGLSRERIRQLQQRALDKLRRTLRAAMR
jgi:RNA polymerase primary sigma factor